MDAYKKSLELGLTGTDEEIVAALKPTTLYPINLSYLMEMLNFRGMLRKTDGSGGQERWQGTLQNLKTALIGLDQAEFVEAYETWFSHVTNPRQISWDTSIPAYAIAFGQMEANFAGGPSMPTANDFAAVAALGGGRPYADLTVEQYALEKAAYEADQALAAATALRTAKINQWRNRVTSAVSEWDAGHVAEAAAELTSVAAEMGQ